MYLMNESVDPYPCVHVQVKKSPTQYFFFETCNETPNKHVCALNQVTHNCADNVRETPVQSRWYPHLHTSTTWTRRRSTSNTFRSTHILNIEKFKSSSASPQMKMEKWKYNGGTRTLCTDEDDVQLTDRSTAVDVTLPMEPS
jgi:hypothetical protein